MLSIDGNLDLDETGFVIVFNLANSLVVLHHEPSVFWVGISELRGLALPIANWNFSIHQVDVNSVHLLDSWID